MKNNSLKRTVLTCLMAGAILLFLQAAFREKTGGYRSKESMETCCRKDDGGSKMIWENLSHQFFSSF